MTLSPRCLKDASRVSNGSFKSVSLVFQGYVMGLSIDASRMLQEYLPDVSRIFHSCFGYVWRESQACIKGVPRMSQRHFSGVSLVFESCFRWNYKWNYKWAWAEHGKTKTWENLPLMDCWLSKKSLLTTFQLHRISKVVFFFFFFFFFFYQNGIKIWSIF